MPFSLRRRSGADPHSNPPPGRLEPVPLAAAPRAGIGDLVLRAPDTAVSVGEPNGVPAPPGFVAFTGYALDCEIQAFVAEAEVDGTRWSDLLNASTEIRLRDTVLIGLEDRVPRVVGDLIVLRHELVAAWASPFRGSPELRVSTRAERVTFRAGPYRLQGFLHALPTADVIAAFGRRGELVPLTDASIEVPGTPEAPELRAVASGSTLIVNRTFLHDLRLWRSVVDLPVVARTFAERVPAREYTGELIAL
jgi:hypothetical protein